jgi:2-haloacid dehalogenase
LALPQPRLHCGLPWLRPHKFDLKAANAAGFRTAYVPRPLELGPETKVDRSPETYIDVVADDMIDLSRKIGLA